MKDERVTIAIPKALHRRLVAQGKRTRLALRIIVEDAINGYLLAEEAKQKGVKKNGR